MSSLEQSLLKELFDYNPETGVFIRRVGVSNILAGTIAGSANNQGYLCICINNTTYKAHRLAWIYMYGSIPKGLTIDHKNGIRGDNRIENLRLATRAEQCQNVNIQKSNTSGYIGVHLDKKYNVWVARISVGGKRETIGRFDTPEAANDARILRKAELHTFNPKQR